MKKFNSQQDILKQVEINKVEVHTRTTHSYFTVLGEEGLGTAEDHYDQIETLKHANQGDMYVMTLSSCPGGCYSGLLAFKNALEGTHSSDSWVIWLVLVRFCLCSLMRWLLLHLPLSWFIAQILEWAETLQVM